jgi:hypothetical protein
LLHKPSNENDVIELLKSKVQTWEKSFSGDIIIPTSGGFDSRLLNTLVEDKSRIRAFTYGLSPRQEKSREVIYAKKLTEILGVSWQQVRLGDFHLYMDDWYGLYGASTGAFGLYHMEFFSKIHEMLRGKRGLLSGIIGDVWAGNLAIAPMKSANDLIRLGFTHGIRADPTQLLQKSKKLLYEDYYEREKDMLNDALYRIVAAVRLKLIFLSYLYRIPKYFGYEPWSPFLDEEVGIAMLNLPESRKRNRQWQIDYFKKQGVYMENMQLQWDRTNSLNHVALKRVPVAPLNVALLKEIINPRYIAWINKELLSKSIFVALYSKLMYTPLIKGGLHLLGLKDRYMEAYHAYMTIKPLELLIQQRNKSHE